MGAFKKIFKNKKSLAWAITTISLAVLLAAVNILASGYLNTLICNRFGGPRAITASGSDAGIFVADFKTKADAYNNGNEVTKQICEEGMVLLKNENGALPLKNGAKVSVFGKNSVNLVYGGSGSAAPKQDEPTKTIFDSLTAAGFFYNPTLVDFYGNDEASGTPRSKNPAMDNGGVSTLETGETPIAKYTSAITSTYSSYNDAALVVFSRIAGENWDLPRKASDDPSHHYLQLDNNEKALLEHVCSSGFAHIVVLINSSNNIDLGFLKFEDDPAYQSKIDAAILIGSPGANGIMALGEILAGTVNPSGHTVDTLYTHYEKDPTWQNFGDNLEANGDCYIVDGNKQPYYFVDYEENIYMGYRYYETRGHVEGESWYSKNVVYPFGHGLSYTSFEQSLLNESALSSKELDSASNFSVQIRVKNTGKVPGKQVIQLYATAPYSDGKIEKPYKTLVGFAKTKLLKENQEQTLTIDVNPYDLASFDDKDRNGNGFAGYELEKGEYLFHLGTDAHNDFATFRKNLSSDYRYDKDPITGYEVKPLFEKASEHLQSDLSRKDFEGTFPKMPTEQDRSVSREFLNEEENHTSDNPEDLSVMPKMDQPLTVAFKDLIGKKYDDPLWESFLDQLTFDEMVTLFNGGSYSTPAIERLGIPKTISCDGPTGIVAFMGTPEVYGTCYYCSECLLAQTYNLELAEKQGNAIGNECLVGDQKSSNLPYTGWYSPGVNLHRSPFGGRNTEYYSEDPLLSGKFAAKVILKAQEKGVYCNVKHFCLNEQETHRSINGQNYWCREQAIRELYLKPFEIAIKEGKSRGLMSSFTRIGQRWTGGCYSLLTTVLRKEWGFQGSVICDFHTDSYMNNRQMAFAGGDLNLTTTKFWTKASKDAAADVNVLRRASHNNLYALVNSNAVSVDILGYRLPLWQELLYIGDGVIAAILIVWGIFAIRSALREKGKAE